ncbi:MAG: glycosyltransferase family 2 protein [Acidobacteriaceae bacterium]
MMVAALSGMLGLCAGLLLIRRVPTCPPAGRRAEESVSIIIPARNEEANLPRLLNSISRAAQRPTEVIVMNDGSTDGTAAVADRLGARVLHAEEKPAGWTGKSWACYRGAQSARGDVLLFLDADTYFLSGGLERLLSCWSREQDEHLVLSVLPYHATEAGYEQLSLFFNVLMAAGAGGFNRVSAPRLFGQSLLISRKLYFEGGGHAAVRGVVLENLRWAKRLRESGARILCLGGEGTLQMRLFPDGIQQMSESWAKAFLQGATDSGITVLGIAIAWICALWSTAILIAMPAEGSRVSIVLVYVVLSLQIAWMARQLGSYRLLSCLLYPLPLFYYCLIFGRAAMRRALGRKAVWRGREV